MRDRIRAYPMIVLLLPLVVAILFCERTGMFYSEEKAVYDSLCVHTFVIDSEHKKTTKCERYEAETYGGKVYIYVLRDSMNTLLHKGDTLIATTRIRKTESLGQFDYRKYLLRQGIIGSAFVKRYELKRSASYSIPLQKRLYQRLSSAGLDGDELATAGALCLGYKEDLDSEIKRYFQASGAAHVLAVSGLHTGIIYVIVMWLMTIGGRIKPRYENQIGHCVNSIVIIATMWGYAWLTGMTPSVVRAVIMVTIIETGKMLYRQSISLNSIAAAAFFILMVRPIDLWSVGFQLSFAATTAIVIFATPCERLLPRLKINGLPRKIYTLVIGTTLISIIAQLGTIPLTIYYFGYVSTYFIITNLIVLPLATLLVPCSLISLLLGSSWIGIWWTKVTIGLSWLMNHSVGWIESLPGSTFPANANGIMIAIYYVLLILMGWIMNMRK